MTVDGFEKKNRFGLKEKKKSDTPKWKGGFKL